MVVIPRVTGWRVAFAILLASSIAIPITAMAQSTPDTTGAGVSAPVSVSSDTAATPPPPPAPSQVTATAPAAVAATPAPAAAPQNAGMFSKGKRRVSGTIGWGSSYGNDYLLVGLGVGYFIRNGIDVGVDLEGWFIGDPTQYKVSPRADYVMWKMPRIKPYGGVFYRYSFVSDFDDQSSVGARAGAFYKGARGGMAGAGVVWERYLDIPEPFNSDVVYPEIFVAISF
jgi:hypothetical protein